MTVEQPEGKSKNLKLDGTCYTSEAVVYSRDSHNGNRYGLQQGVVLWWCYRMFQMRFCKVGLGAYSCLQTQGLGALSMVPDTAAVYLHHFLRVHETFVALLLVRHFSTVVHVSLRRAPSAALAL